MEFRLLGPLEVGGRDGSLALGDIKQRSLLAVRGGTRPGGLAPAETRTRFSWSLAGTAS